MNWIDYEFPYTAYIVEVKYSGDVAITECRCNDMPKPRDSSRGFTQGFWDYVQAARYARHCRNELNIKALV
jgi:hypothetical protein